MGNQGLSREQLTSGQSLAACPRPASHRQVPRHSPELLGFLGISPRFDAAAYEVDCEPGTEKRESPSKFWPSDSTACLLKPSSAARAEESGAQYPKR